MQCSRKDAPFTESQTEPTVRQKTLQKKYHIPKVYENIQDIFTDENVDIIYISTPHNTHIQYLKEALRHGKHILCEKSITLNSRELEEAKQLAEENQLILAIIKSMI